MFYTLLTHLSEGFYYLNHELLLAKLNAYGFTLPLSYNYLRNRKQRVRVNDSYILWQNILLGVPQVQCWSILGPLLFNIYLANLFFTLNNAEIASYSDDTMSYAVSNNIDGLIFENIVI